MSARLDEMVGGFDPSVLAMVREAEIQVERKAGHDLAPQWVAKMLEYLPGAYSSVRELGVRGLRAAKDPDHRAAILLLAESAATWAEVDNRICAYLDAIEGAS